LFVSGSRNVPFVIIGRDKSRPYTVFMNMFLSRNTGHRHFQPQKQALTSESGFILPWLAVKISKSFITLEYVSADNGKKFNFNGFDVPGVF